MLVAIYVHDIDVAYNCPSMFQSFRVTLTHKFQCKDIGELSKGFIMGIMRTADYGLFL